MAKKTEKPENAADPSAELPPAETAADPAAAAAPSAEAPPAVADENQAAAGETKPDEDETPPAETADATPPDETGAPEPLTHRQRVKALAVVLGAQLGLEPHIALARVEDFVHRCKFERGAPDVVPGLEKLPPEALAVLLADDDEERIRMLKAVGLLYPEKEE